MPKTFFCSFEEFTFKRLTYEVHVFPIDSQAYSYGDKLQICS